MTQKTAIFKTHWLDFSCAFRSGYSTDTATTFNATKSFFTAEFNMYVIPKNLGTDIG